MKQIETKGITFIELLSENSDWYCGTDYASGDLYEAEEIYASGKRVIPNRLIFIHKPDGKLVEPLLLHENQYLGRPIQVDGSIYLLLVDFAEQFIRIINCGKSFEQLDDLAVIPLTAVEDCYNLLLAGSPLLQTRQGSNHCFEVIWPDRLSFLIGNSESFLYRDGERYVFSRWFEDPDYREEVLFRSRDGAVTDVIPGSFFITPSGEKWVLR